MIFNSCRDDQTVDDQMELLLCDIAEKQFTSQVFEGSFYPCRTDGLQREYLAIATFKVVSDSTYMHLVVNDLDLDTIIAYKIFCEYNPLESSDAKTFLNFGNPIDGYLSDYNPFYNSVGAWFQYEENCELGLFASWIE